MSESDEFTRLNNAYHTAIELWKLASQQIYNRFAAMLTANSIILSIISLSFTERFAIPPDIRKWLIVLGLVICFVWILFMVAGWKVECHYRQKYDRFEKDAIPSGQKIAIPICDWRSWFFLLGTGLTIFVFVIVYLILLKRSW